MLSSQCLLCVEGDVERTESYSDNESQSNLFVLWCYAAPGQLVDTHADLSFTPANRLYPRFRNDAAYKVIIRASSTKLAMLCRLLTVERNERGVFASSKHQQRDEQNRRP
jgi:hypothetical protein